MDDSVDELSSHLLSWEQTVIRNLWLECKKNIVQELTTPINEIDPFEQFMHIMPVVRYQPFAITYALFLRRKKDCKLLLIWDPGQECFFEPNQLNSSTQLSFFPFSCSITASLLGFRSCTNFIRSSENSLIRFVADPSCAIEILGGANEHGKYVGRLFMLDKVNGLDESRKLIWERVTDEDVWFFACLINCLNETLTVASTALHISPQSESLQTELRIMVHHRGKDGVVIQHRSTNETVATFDTKKMLFDPRPGSNTGESLAITHDEAILVALIGILSPAELINTNEPFISLYVSRFGVRAGIGRLKNKDRRLALSDVGVAKAYGFLRALYSGKLPTYGSIYQEKQDLAAVTEHFDRGNQAAHSEIHKHNVSPVKGPNPSSSLSTFTSTTRKLLPGSGLFGSTEGDAGGDSRLASPIAKRLKFD